MVVNGTSVAAASSPTLISRLLSRAMIINRFGFANTLQKFACR